MSVIERLRRIEAGVQRLMDINQAKPQEQRSPDFITIDSLKSDIRIAIQDLSTIY